MPVLMKTALHLGRTAVPPDPELRRLIEDKFVWWVLDERTVYDEYGYIVDDFFVGVCPEFELIRHGSDLPNYMAVYSTLENGEKRVKFIRESV